MTYRQRQNKRKSMEQLKAQTRPSSKVIYGRVSQVRPNKTVSGKHLYFESDKHLNRNTDGNIIPNQTHHNQNNTASLDENKQNIVDQQNNLIDQNNWIQNPNQQQPNSTGISFYKGKDGQIRDGQHNLMNTEIRDSGDFQKFSHTNGNRGGTDKNPNTKVNYLTNKEIIQNAQPSNSNDPNQSNQGHRNIQNNQISQSGHNNQINQNSQINQISQSGQNNQINQSGQNNQISQSGQNNKNYQNNPINQSGHNNQNYQNNQNYISGNKKVDTDPSKILNQGKVNDPRAIHNRTYVIPENNKILNPQNIIANNLNRNTKANELPIKKQKKKFRHNEIALIKKNPKLFSRPSRKSPHYKKHKSKSNLKNFNAEMDRLSQFGKDKTDTHSIVSALIPRKYKAGLIKNSFSVSANKSLMTDHGHYLHNRNYFQTSKIADNKSWVSNLGIQKRIDQTKDSMRMSRHSESNTYNPSVDRFTSPRPEYHAKGFQYKKVNQSKPNPSWGHGNEVDHQTGFIQPQDASNLLIANTKYVNKPTGQPHNQANNNGLSSGVLARSSSNNVRQVITGQHNNQVNPRTSYHLSNTQQTNPLHKALSHSPNIKQNMVQSINIATPTANAIVIQNNGNNNGRSSIFNNEYVPNKNHTDIRQTTEPRFVTDQNRQSYGIASNKISIPGNNLESRSGYSGLANDDTYSQSSKKYYINGYYQTHKMVDQRNQKNSTQSFTDSQYNRSLLHNQRIGQNIQNNLKSTDTRNAHLNQYSNGRIVNSGPLSGQKEKQVVHVQMYNNPDLPINRKVKYKFKNPNVSRKISNSNQTPNTNSSISNSNLNQQNSYVVNTQPVRTSYRASQTSLSKHSGNQVVYQTTDRKIEYTQNKPNSKSILISDFPNQSNLVQTSGNKTHITRSAYPAQPTNNSQGYNRITHSGLKQGITSQQTGQFSNRPDNVRVIRHSQTDRLSNNNFSTVTPGHSLISKDNYQTGKQPSLQIRTSTVTQKSQNKISPELDSYKLKRYKKRINE